MDNLLVLKNMTLITGEGEPPIAAAALVIRDGEVEYAGPTAIDKYPQDARVLDLAGRFVIPGLIDTHIHLDCHGMADTYKENLVEDKLRAIRASKEMADTLKAGYTTVRSVGSVNLIDIAVREAVNRGLIPGPRILAAGRIIAMTCSGAEYFLGMYRDADGVDECRKAAREQLKAGADLLKVMATGAFMNPGGVPGAVQLDEEEIRVVVAEGEKLGKPTAAHAHGAQGIKNAVKAGVSTIEHGTLADDEALKMMADKGVFLIPTLIVGELWRNPPAGKAAPDFMVQKMEDREKDGPDLVRRAMDLGVAVAMGTDAGTNFNYHGLNSREIVLYVDRGLMTPQQALESATRVAAEAVGMEDRIGTLTKGKLADLVVLKENPLERIACLAQPENSVEMVFKEGKRVV